MKGWKIGFFTLLVIFIVSVIFLSYKIIDQAVTVSYTNDSYMWKEQENELLTKIINSRSYSKLEIQRLVKDINDLDLLMENGDTIYWFGKSLIFKNDTLNQVIDTN